MGEGGPSGFASSMQRDAFLPAPSRYLCQEGTPTETQALGRRGSHPGLFRQQGAVLHPSQEKRNPVTAGGEECSCQAPAQPPLGTKFSVGFLGVTRVPQKVAGLRDTEGHIMRGSIYVKYLAPLKAD